MIGARSESRFREPTRFSGDDTSEKEAHMQDRLTYTVPEVAELLGISRSTAYECIRRGEIPALVLGRRVLVARTTLGAMLQQASLLRPEAANEARQ